MSATGDRNHRTPEPPAIRSEEEVAKIHAGHWQAWVATLTADEKQQLADLKLIAPNPAPRRKRPRAVQDEEEENHLGNFDHLPSDVLDPAAALAAKERAAGIVEPDEAEPIAEVQRRELMILSHVMPVISDAADARLEASLVALALKIGKRQNITDEGLVKRHHVPLPAVWARVRAWQMSFEVCSADLKLLRYVIAPVLRSRQPGLEAAVITKAARIGLANAMRMEDVGAKYGVCRQAISRRVRHWCQHLHVLLPRECKRNTEAYRLYNVRKENNDPFK